MAPWDECALAVRVHACMLLHARQPRRAETSSVRTPTPHPTPRWATQLPATPYTFTQHTPVLPEKKSRPLGKKHTHLPPHTSRIHLSVHTQELPQPAGTVRPSASIGRSSFLSPPTTTASDTASAANTSRKIKGRKQSRDAIDPRHVAVRSHENGAAVDAVVAAAAYGAGVGLGAVSANGRGGRTVTARATGDLQKYDISGTRIYVWMGDQRVKRRWKTKINLRVEK